MMTRCLLRAPLLALALCAQWSTEALADDAAPPGWDGALPTKARDLVREGREAEKQKQWDTARLYYLMAYRTQAHPQVALRLGISEVELGRYRDAAEHLSLYLREARDLPSAGRSGAEPVEASFARARAQVAAIVVSADRPGAEVFVDGSPAGKTPLAGPLFVDAGHHLIELRLAGFEPHSRDYYLTPGGEAMMRASFTPVTAPPNASNATSASKVSQVSAPAAPPPAFQPPLRLKPFSIAALTLSGAAALVGVGLAAASGQKAAASGDCEIKACDGLTTVAARHEQFDHLQSQKTALGGAAVGAFVGAGLLAGGALTYTLVSERRKPAARAGVSVYPGGAAASVSMEW